MKKKLTIENLRNKVYFKNFDITYEEAINLEDPTCVDYIWTKYAGGKQVLEYICIPSLGDVMLFVNQEKSE